MNDNCRKHWLKSKLFLATVIIWTNFCYSQGYNVQNYQKINETNGGFTGNLDNYDSWGIAIDNIGDLDGNGVNDLAVGAYTDDDGGFNRGAVYILFLDNNNQVISYSKISDTSGNFTGVLDDDDRFGGSVSYLGDLNSDGLIELAVGADYDGDGGYWHGAVWILSLNSDGTVNSHVKISDTEGGFTGVINGDAIFGTDMENIGDLNKDGIIDLAVGSRRDADGGSRRGAIWILFMNNDLTVNSYQKISDTQGGFTPSLDFEDYFGGSILNFGDQNGDGNNDLIVGAYRDDDLNINSGSFYLLYLNNDGTVQNSVKISNTNGGLTNEISTNALFGESIDGTNDIDGDGIPEILVGALGHFNPTLSQNTGAFYMIELNSNGMVTQDLLYTYGEYCFSGELTSGDYFGGAITLMESGPNPKIAVSAYHDSENGPERGAIWILDLGEKTYSITDMLDPSCGSNDGSFVVSGLIANVDYLITYDFEGNTISDYYLSDSNGTFEVVNLSSGTYQDIVVTESLINCSDELGSITLIDVSINPSILPISPTACGLSDGAIEIENLIPNSYYEISYSTNGLITTNNLTADLNGRVTISNLTTGVYEDFQVVDTVNSCSSTPTQLIIDDIGFNIQNQITIPSNCGIDDGMITITNTTPNTTYNISFQNEGLIFNQDYTSNNNGEISILNLSSGLYESFEVFDNLTGCIANLGTIEIIPPDFDVGSFHENPSFCGMADGQISFSGLKANSTYNLSYSVDTISSSINFTSDNSGNYLWENLEAGEYTGIILIDQMNGCQSTIDDIILTTPIFSPQVIATPPTSCISDDGAILISGLLPNTIYEISYGKNSNQIQLNLVSNSLGYLSIDSLTAGEYVNFSIVGNSGLCSDILPIVELGCDGELIGCFVTKSFFTPNGDGINDLWFLDTIDNCDYEIQIFDRYGKLLRTLTPLDPYWDGTFNGRRMPSNDYWYSVQYSEATDSKIFQSHFSLKR